MSDKSLNPIDFFDTNFWIGHHYLSGQKSRDIEGLDDILLKLYSKNRITSVMISSFDSLYYHPRSGNDILSEHIKKITNKGYKVFGCWLFEHELIADSVAFEKAMRSRIGNGFYCLRLMPKSHRYPYKRTMMEEVYKVCEKYSYPIILSIDEIDITGNKDIEWEEVLDIASCYPDMPVIIDGGNSKELAYTSYIFSVLSRSKNIYLNTHNLLAINQIEDICSRFGPERLVFDTYFPFYNPDMSTDRILLSGLCDDDKKKIAFHNFNNILQGVKR